MINATETVHEGNTLATFDGILVLVVSYDASLLDGFHFWEKLDKILFEGIVLDGFYGIPLTQVMFGNGNCAIKSENVRGGDSIDDFRRG